MSDVDTALVDSLKVLDPKRPIREADILRGERHGETLRKTLIRQSRFSQALGVPGKILRPTKRDLIL